MGVRERVEEIEEVAVRDGFAPRTSKREPLHLSSTPHFRCSDGVIGLS